jgi:hypothetical protein
LECQSSPSSRAKQGYRELPAPPKLTIIGGDLLIHHNSGRVRSPAAQHPWPLLRGIKRHPDLPVPLLPGLPWCSGQGLPSRALPGGGLLAAATLSPASLPPCSNSGVVTHGDRPCSCPKRALLPSSSEPPTVPCALTPENLPKLKQFLLYHYTVLTFNICEHQPLLMLENSPTLKLHISPEVQPKAVHKPATIPLHWQSAVHEGIQRDIRLGVIERCISIHQSPGKAECTLRPSTTVRPAGQLTTKTSTGPACGDPPHTPSP